MSIIVSVKIHDGIVMATDSAVTFAIGQIYENANKIVNLVKGQPIGVMTCGAGGVGNASIATLLKDLRSRLADGDSEWKLDTTNYTMDHVTSRVDTFFTERAKEADFKQFLLLRICGYSSRRPLPEVWQVAFNEGKHLEPTCVQSENNIGPRWDGEMEALDRMILGLGAVSPEVVASIGMMDEQVREVSQKLIPHLYENLILPAAPIQDAIDLARFMVETTKGFIRFSIKRAKTVGGAVEIAAITKHEGFKWVQRKHFFPHDLNVA
jgi:hypothetical protein